MLGAVKILNPASLRSSHASPLSHMIEQKKEKSGVDIVGMFD